MSRALSFAVFIFFVLAGCRQDDKEMSQTSRDSYSDATFDEAYSAWRLKVTEFKLLSKTYPIQELPEYHAIHALGEKALPKLKEKLQVNDGMDFVLCDIIIELKRWDIDEFAKYDRGRRSREVLDRLNAESP